MLLAQLLLVGTFLLGVAGTNLLENAGFEDPSLGNYWIKWGCSWAISTTEKREGAQSVHVTGRSGNWAGIGYTVGLSDGIAAGKIYAFSGYIKLENLAPGVSYHKVEFVVRYKSIDDIKEIHIYIQIAEPEVNYYFDDGSLVELIPDPDWRATAESDIDANRKASFDIIIRKKEAISLADFTLEGNLTFDEANATINDLLNNGLSVRGHNIVWDVDKRVPNWVQAIKDPEVLKAAIYERLSSTVDLTKGRLVHWDVNNEVLHGDFFERKTGNVNITMDMFRNMSVADPNTKLFINDYDVMNSGSYTTSYLPLWKAKDYLAAGVPLHGVGVQSHLHSSDIDITRLKYRLNKMAEAGFPLWITEMTLNEADVTTKAQGIEDVMTLYFSHNMLNAAGQKYIDLVNTRWRTNWSGKLKTYRNERYFKGDYSIKVKKSGVTLKTVKVNLPSKSKIIIRVKGTNASPKVIFRIR